jgi:dienelactone hydrolase
MTNADGETPPTRDRTVDIAVEGQHIEGTVVAPDPSTPGVLFVHGWGGSQNHYLARAREIAQLGCVCLTFDLRGHGSTQEQQHTVNRHTQDACEQVHAARLSPVSVTGHASRKPQGVTPTRALMLCCADLGRGQAACFDLPPPRRRY